jgi:hypothetical protein
MDRTLGGTIIVSGMTSPPTNPTSAAISKGTGEFVSSS